VEQHLDTVTQDDSQGQAKNKANDQSMFGIDAVQDFHGAGHQDHGHQAEQHFQVFHHITFNFNGLILSLGFYPALWAFHQCYKLWAWAVFAFADLGEPVERFIGQHDPFWIGEEAFRQFTLSSIFTHDHQPFSVMSRSWATE
jgi:hypothetical protein